MPPLSPPKLNYTFYLGDWTSACGRNVLNYKSAQCTVRPHTSLPTRALIACDIFLGLGQIA